MGGLSGDRLLVPKAGQQPNEGRCVKVVRPCVQVINLLTIIPLGH